MKETTVRTGKPVKRRRAPVTPQMLPAGPDYWPAPALATSKRKRAAGRDTERHATAKREPA